MLQKYDGVTVKQIDNMKHALGYSKDKVKRYSYKAYRNYYTTGEPSESWGKLVELGLATGNKFSNGCGNNPMVYFVSDEGKIFLGELLGIKITEMD